jgi:hypothetical protein
MCFTNVNEAGIRYLTSLHIDCKCQCMLLSIYQKLSVNYTMIRQHKDNGQKYLHASNLPYIFHINLLLHRPQKMKLEETLLYGTTKNETRRNPFI